MTQQQQQLYDTVCKAAELHGVNSGEAGHEVGDLQLAITILLSTVRQSDLHNLQLTFALELTDWEEAVKAVAQA